MNMANITREQNEQDLRDRVKYMIKNGQISGGYDVTNRQLGLIMTDMNGHDRYVRVQIVVAEERDNMTPRELMQSEIDKYQEACDKREADRLKHEADVAKAKAKAKAKREADTESASA
jgi:hypothetical protein